MESVSRISWRKRRVQCSVPNHAVRNSVSPTETKALQGRELDVRTRLSKELALPRAANSGMTEISIWELGISISKFITALTSLWGFKLVKFTYLIILFTFPKKGKAIPPRMFFEVIDIEPMYSSKKYFLLAI